MIIIRDLYRCPTEDLYKAIAAGSQTVLYRGVVGPASSLEAPDIEYLAAHPEFDPSLSFVAYDSGDPVAFLVSRIGAADRGSEAVWSLFGGRAEAGHALEMLLDDAKDHWREEGASRARKGPTGLLGSEPRMAEDSALVDLLKDRGFEVKAESAEMELELKSLAPPGELAELEAEMRRKGYLVRQARPDEVAVVARQYDPRHTGLVSQEFWNLLVRHLQPDALVVLEHRRQIIGYTAYLGWTLQDECPHLAPVFVERVHRGTGLDAILLRRALDAAKHRGKTRVRRLCGSQELAFYQRAGFAVAARFCHEATMELK